MPRVIGVENGSIEAVSEIQANLNLWTNTKRHKITYIVLGDSLNDTEETIRQTAGVPQMFDQYLGMYCRSRVPREVERVRHPRLGVPCGLWYVDCFFDNLVDPSQDTGEGYSSTSANLDNPTYQRPAIEWDYETEEGILEADLETGEPIVNTANQSIAVTKPITIAILSLTRYELWPFDPALIDLYGNTVNDAEFWGYPKGVAWMLPMTTKEEVVSGRVWQKTTYRIKFRLERYVAGFIPSSSGGVAFTLLMEDSWNARPLNEGTRYLNQYGQYVDNMDSHNNPATCNLAEDGTRLDDDEDPIYLNYHRIPYAHFQDLELEPFSSFAAHPPAH